MAFAASSPNEMKETDLCRGPDDDTTEVDQRYLETVTIHGRDFQAYSITHGIHLLPVDEVRDHYQRWQ